MLRDVISWLKEPTAAVRLSLAAVTGILVGIFLPPASKWELHALAGWCSASLIFLLLSAWVFFTTDEDNTRRLATREDDSRAASSLIVLVGSLGSLAGVIYSLTQVRGLQQAGQNTEATLLTILGLTSVALSWLTIQAVYTFRYARLYFEEPEGGIEFQDAGSPDYLDFLYLALTIGMTFQVSDTGIAERKIRRTVIRHALLSYLFGTVIVGVAINVVGNLIK